jgi:calcineurin-like phosphoesterase family protein
MLTYFSSDWHLGHANIIKYDKRPFKDTEEMNRTIIQNYNSIVKLEDEFYFLGDFCMGDRSKAESYFQQLIPNKKFFIAGNHDGRETVELYKKYGTYLGKMAEIRVEGQGITLNHYCMKVWNKSHHGNFHLYGHSHGSLPDDPNALSFDVGVNCWDYKPISFEEVKRTMAKKTFKPIDHHGDPKRALTQ